MRFLIGALATSAVMLASADASTLYATAVDWQNNGTNGGSFNRDVATNALGATDGQFLALGLSSKDNPSFAVFSFGQQFTGPMNLVEVTFNCRLLNDGSCSHREAVDVYVGNDYAFGSHDFSDLDDFTRVGQILNGDAEGMGAMLNFAGNYTYLALVDVSAYVFSRPNSGDGFDIDSISVTAFDDITPTPVPAAALLMAPALGGMALRRRKK